MTDAQVRRVRRDVQTAQGVHGQERHRLLRGVNIPNFLPKGLDLYPKCAYHRRMATVIKELKCLRCDKRWYPRQPAKPVMCPNCRSRRWDEAP